MSTKISDEEEVFSKENEKKHSVDEVLAAARKGDEVLKVLIRNGADVNVVDDENSTSLHIALREGHVDVAKVLIRNGAEVNAVNENKMTALHFAAHIGHVDVMKVLIQNGVDVNAVDDEKSTALYTAIWHFHRRKSADTYEVAKVVLQLLCFGADLDEKTIDAADCEPKFPQPLYDVLISLRDGNSTKTTFMSNEERRFMWNLGFVLAVKHPAIAFRTYHMILSFITFHGLFMGPGYDLGEGSIWRLVILCEDGAW